MRETVPSSADVNAVCASSSYRVNATLSNLLCRSMMGVGGSDNQGAVEPAHRRCVVLLAFVGGLTLLACACAFDGFLL